MPSRSYKRDDGTVGSMPMVDFRDKETRRRFQEPTLVALDKFFAEDH